MKIALTCLLTRAVVKDTRGGTESFTYNLTEELMRRKHAVTLYASSDSQTSAQLISMASSTEACITALEGNLAQPYSLLMAQKLAANADAYDVIHNNFFHTYIMQSFSPFIHTPMVHTVHNVYYGHPAWKKALMRFTTKPQERIVFVSRYAQHTAGDIPRSQVIYNGIAENVYNYNESADQYCLWIGRMVPEKGPDDAVLIAQKTDHELVLFTPLINTSHYEYFKTHIKPHLTNRITAVTETTLQQKIVAYQKAKAFLFPIHWEEPFGLVMIEAMACGTPVIAYARGSVPEVVEDGKTGFIVNSSPEDIRGTFIVKKTGVEGMKEAVERLYALPDSAYIAMRRACRAAVENRFTITKMVNAYETLYKSLVENVL